MCKKTSVLVDDGFPKFESYASCCFLQQSQMTTNPLQSHFGATLGRREFHIHVNFMSNTHKVATLCHTNGRPESRSSKK